MRRSERATRWFGFYLMAWLGLGLMPGCAGGGGQDDAGLDAADAGEDGADQGGGDEIATARFTVRVPRDLSLCALTQVDPRDYRAALEAKARLELATGAHHLDWSETSAAVEWSSHLAVGPNGEGSEATGEGRLERSPGGAVTDGVYQLTLRKPYRLGLVAFEAVGSLEVLVQDGAAPAVLLSETAIANTLQEFLVQTSPFPLPLAPCSLAHASCLVHNLTLAGGDLLKVEACAFCPEGWMCKASMGGLKRARFTRGRETRETTDYFHLAHTWLHHDWGQHVLVVLEPPLEGIRAVALTTDAYPNHDKFANAIYLDTDFRELETRKVNEHTTAASW